MHEKDTSKAILYSSEISLYLILERTMNKLPKHHSERVVTKSCMHATA